VATAVGAAGGGVGRGLVPQVAAAAVGADEGIADGSLGPHMATVPAVREADGDTGQGSDPQEVAFTSSTTSTPAASGGWLQPNHRLW
jgi:hypothetical protein